MREKRNPAGAKTLIGLLVMGALLRSGATDARGDVRLADIFGHHMTLQRERVVPVWGRATPGETVHLRFAGQTRETAADALGRWRVDLDAMPASGEGRELVVTGQNTITLTNVVVGEVWLCSGQSNMLWPLRQAEGGPEARDAADYPMIRLLKIPIRASETPMEDVDAAWTPCAPATADSFSAVGFFFGRKLFEELNVPIGLIGSSWGGTKIGTWMPPAGFEAVPELAPVAAPMATWNPARPEGRAAYEAALDATRKWLPLAEEAIRHGAYPPPRPSLPVPLPVKNELTVAYNGMIHPLVPFALRGAIWYQGEADQGLFWEYVRRKQALVQSWRDVFENPELPFYFVQLANYLAASGNPGASGGFAKIREAQRRCLGIPNTGMAVAIDIGEGGNLHPVNKLDVGLRLAYWALARDYGRDIVYSGPLYRSHDIVEGGIRVFFNHTGLGLMAGRKEGLAPTVATPEAKLARFAVAGKDKVWRWAEAVIEPTGDSVLVSTPDVPAPVAVRYAFAANPEGCNLYNKEGLPASPFRTDDW